MAQDLLLTAQRLIEPLHQAKKKAQAGDWLEENDELGQTYKQFKLQQKTPHSKSRNKFYLQPIGHFSAGQLRLAEDTKTAMSIFFGREVAMLPAMSLEAIPKKARRTRYGDLQLLSGYILETLQKSVPKDAISVLALTSNDLWPGENWNFVFGEATLTERVGVWSLFRYRDPETEYELCLQRTLKVAIHETGHMLGIEHCIAYECGMNGSNSLDETDRTPLPFCPECERKLWWFLELEPSQRYKSLSSFATEHGLKEEALFWQKSEGAILAQDQ
jgi:archaemetzincin